MSLIGAPTDAIIHIWIAIRDEHHIMRAIRRTGMRQSDLFQSILPIGVEIGRLCLENNVIHCHIPHGCIQQRNNIAIRRKRVQIPTHILIKSKNILPNLLFQRLANHPSIGWIPAGTLYGDGSRRIHYDAYFQCTGIYVALLLRHHFIRIRLFWRILQHHHLPLAVDVGAHFLGTQCHSITLRTRFISGPLGT